MCNESDVLANFDATLTEQVTALLELQGDTRSRLAYAARGIRAIP
jgi:hypothetical protein